MRLHPVFLIFAGTLLINSCGNDKRYHEVKSESKVLHTHALREIDSFQKKMNAEFRDPEVSPLPDRYRMKFEGLEFFPPDTTFRVWAKLEYTPDAEPFLMPTTTERKSMEVVYAIAQFTLRGRQYELELYQNQELMTDPGYEDYLFLPFLDATNGNETYEGGRYINLRIPEEDTLLIDFNKAYNPYCAYNKKYSCPIVPKVNTLDIPVRAGVKSFRPQK